MLNTTDSITNITTLVIATIIVFVIGYIIRLVVNNAINTFFENNKERDKKIDLYRNEVTKLITTVQELVLQLKSYKELNQSENKNRDYRFGKMEKEMALITTIEKEHYNELRGKVDKTNNKLSVTTDKIELINNKLIKLQSDHDNFKRK